jgi:uncharacterized membrane protein
MIEFTLFMVIGMVVILLVPVTMVIIAIALNMHKECRRQFYYLIGYAVLAEAFLVWFLF